jgi:hypothetical protein
MVACCGIRFGIGVTTGLVFLMLSIRGASDKRAGSQNITRTRQDLHGRCILGSKMYNRQKPETIR